MAYVSPVLLLVNPRHTTSAQDRHWTVSRYKYLEVIVNTVERLIVRFAGSPADAATVCLGIVTTLPVSVGADAVDDTTRYSNDKRLTKHTILLQTTACLNCRLAARVRGRVTCERTKTGGGRGGKKKSEKGEENENENQKRFIRFPVLFFHS